MLAKNIIDLIGNTPMLLIPEEVHGVKNLELWAKLEYMNPFGSLKDRTAWALLKGQIGEIAESGKTIIEVSSGNTGKSLQALSSLFGVKTKVLSSMYKVREQKEVLQLLGGELDEVDAASDCFDADDPGDPYYLVREIVEREPDKYFRAGQFDRAENVRIHYETTGAEIRRDLGRVDRLFQGVGSSGSSQGIMKALREGNPDVQCVGVAGARNDSIPGVMKLKELEGAAKASMLFDRSIYSSIIEVAEAEALEHMLVLIRRAGLLVGPSTGASFAAIRRYYRENPEPQQRTVAVFLACDRVESYLSYVRQRMPAIFDARASQLTISSYQGGEDRPEWRVRPEEAAAFIGRERPIIVDIRSAKAFRLKPFPDAINIPVAQFEKLLDGGDPFPAALPILLVCAIGEQTVKYTSFLREKGYRAYSLDRGMRGFALAGSDFL